MLNIYVKVLGKVVGWLFWALQPFEAVFQSISGRLPERGKKKREMRREKMSKQPPPAPTASAVGPPLPFWARPCQASYSVCGLVPPVAVSVAGAER